MIQSKTENSRSLASSLLIVGLIHCVLPTTLSAGSLVEEHLDTVCKVAVVVPIGGLSYEPLHGFDRDDFELQARNRAAAQLERCGLGESARAGASLVFDISKSRNGLPKGLVALRVGAELREKARLVRDWGGNEGSKDLYVTTWRLWESDVVKEEEAVERILHRVSGISRDFAQTVAGARNKPEEPGREPDPSMDACFDGDE